MSNHQLRRNLKKTARTRIYTALFGACSSSNNAPGDSGVLPEHNTLRRGPFEKNEIITIINSHWSDAHFSPLRSEQLSRILIDRGIDIGGR